MKATIRFKDELGRYRQATVNTETRDPNLIIREAVNIHKVKRLDRVTTIKYGRTLVLWNDYANNAFPYDRWR